MQLLADKERLEHERQRLLELDRSRTEFLARISHDLRTPLSSIIGFSDLILTGEAGKLNKRHVDFIEAINRNGHQLLALINDLLDLTTLDAHRMTIRREPVDCAELQADLRAATEPVLLQAGLRIEWQPAEQLAGRIVTCDRRRMVQVLTNLVDNARKFTPRGGTVRVTFDEEGDDAVFAVSDSGPGIPEAERTKMFRPYVSRNGHAGLGLAIVKAIVDLHGGAVTLNDGPNEVRGCTFRIRIPQRQPATVQASA